MSNKRIAELAHVSASTVSKVFSGNDKVSADTAAHVLKTAEENSLLPPRFRKNSLAKKTLRIAILVPEIVSVYYSKIVSAAVEILNSAGIYSEIHITGFDEKSCTHVQSVLQADGLTDGLLLVGIVRKEPSFTIPTVFLSEDELVQFPNTFQISIDEVGNMKQCLTHLTALGHRRIGFIGETNTECKLRSFRSAAEQLQLDIREDDIFISSHRFEMIGCDAARYFLDRKNNDDGAIPSAFICAYDEVAFGLISSLTAAGIRVPQDVSVIGINNIPTAQYGIVPLTTVDNFSDAQVSMCIHILREKITHRDFEMPPKMMIEGKLIVRGSTSRAPETQA